MSSDVVKQILAQIKGALLTDRACDLLLIRENSSHEVQTKVTTPMSSNMMTPRLTAIRETPARREWQQPRMAEHTGRRDG